MNCRIAEGMVNKYINHTLPLNDLEDFLEHIENCSSCYDELATYFIVHKANRRIRFWILKNFWKKISGSQEDISAERNSTEQLWRLRFVH